MSMNDLVNAFKQAKEALERLDAEYKQITEVDLPNARSTLSAIEYGELLHAKGDLARASTFDAMRAAQSRLDIANRDYNLARQLCQNLEGRVNKIKSTQKPLIESFQEAEKKMWLGKTEELLQGLKLDDKTIEVIGKIMAARSFLHGGVTLSIVDHIRSKLGELSKERLAEARQQLLEELQVPADITFKVL